MKISDYNTHQSLDTRFRGYDSLVVFIEKQVEHA